MRTFAGRTRSFASIVGGSIAGALVLFLCGPLSASAGPLGLSAAAAVKAPTKCPAASEVGAALGAKEANPTVKTAADYISCTYGTSVLADRVEMYGDDMTSFEASEKLSAQLRPKTISGLGQKAYYVGGDLFALDNGLLYEVVAVTASLRAEEKLVRELIASP